MKIINKLLLSGFLFFIGCSTNNNIIPIQECFIDNEKAPNWICNNIEINNTITAVGYAEFNPLGFNFQRTTALSLARDELSRKINIKVKNMFQHYESATGIKKEKSIDRNIKNVSKQVSNNILKETILLSTWKDKKQNLYVLVGIKKNKIKDSIKNDF